MTAWIEATLLRILISDDDACGDLTLREALVGSAREAGLAGITVLRGIAGYGRSNHVHEVFGVFAYDLPIVIEIVDTAEKIDAWLPILEEMRQGALVMRAPVQVLASRPGGASAARAFGVPRA